MNTQKETFIINGITYFGNEDYAYTLYLEFLADEESDQDLSFAEWLEMEDNFDTDQFKAE